MVKKCRPIIYYCNNNRQLFLKRNIFQCTKTIKEKCFKAFIKPILDGCCVLHPLLKKTQQKIDEIDKKNYKKCCAILTK